MRLPVDKLLAKFLKPSTLAFLQEARQLPGFTWFDQLHGYVYGRWVHLYIALGTGRHPLAQRYAPLINRLLRWITPPPDAASAIHRLSMADTYHAKVVPLEPARQLLLVNEPVRLENLEKIIPFPVARDIILKNPDHIAVLACPCRACKENPCLPLDVCLVVGEPFASFVVEHQPGRARRISPAQAVAILEAEDRRGHVHHAFFKDAMLGRFYAICNCCACCCAAIQAHSHNTPMLASSGYVCQVDEDLCFGCGYCTTFCQFGALSHDTGTASVDAAACMGCGVCLSKCDWNALSLVRQESRGEPLEIRRLMAMVESSPPPNRRHSDACDLGEAGGG